MLKPHFLNEGLEGGLRCFVCAFLSLAGSVAPLASDKAVSPSCVLGKMLGSSAALSSYCAPPCQANMLGALETSGVGKTSSMQFFPALRPWPCFILWATSSPQTACAQLKVAGDAAGLVATCSQAMLPCPTQKWIRGWERIEVTPTTTLPAVCKDQSDNKTHSSGF